MFGVWGMYVRSNLYEDMYGFSIISIMIGKAQSSWSVTVTRIRLLTRFLCAGVFLFSRSFGFQGACPSMNYPKSTLF